MEARENSGSITVSAGSPGQRQVAVVWERKRAGPLQVRARSVGTPEFTVSELQALFEQVNTSSGAGVTERFYRRGHLHYEGLAWRGELWLDDVLRLGPPTRHDETALLGPRVILVDALVDAVGQSYTPHVMDLKLRELSVFLSAVMGTPVLLPVQGRAWTFTVGSADCAPRGFGYFEEENPQQMPARDASRSMPLKSVSRPDDSMRGIDGSVDEISLPSDVVELWQMFGALPDGQRRQFLQAGAKWQVAMSHWGGQNTLSYALMVVACEALKPPGHDYRNHNIYHVVEALLGEATADQLQKEWLRPQTVRNAQLHSGEFRSSEFVEHMIMSSYQDPTFDQAPSPAIVKLGHYQMDSQKGC